MPLADVADAAGPAALYAHHRGRSQFVTFREKCRQVEDDLRVRHEEELETLKSRLAAKVADARTGTAAGGRGERSGGYRKSAELRGMRRMQKILVRNKRFAEALDMTKAADALEQEEASRQREEQKRRNVQVLEELFQRQAVERDVFAREVAAEEDRLKEAKLCAYQAMFTAPASRTKRSQGAQPRSGHGSGDRFASYGGPRSVHGRDDARSDGSDRPRSRERAGPRGLTHAALQRQQEVRTRGEKRAGRAAGRAWGAPPAPRPRAPARVGRSAQETYGTYRPGDMGFDAVKARVHRGDGSAVRRTSRRRRPSLAAAGTSARTLSAMESSMSTGTGERPGSPSTVQQERSASSAPNPCIQADEASDDDSVGLAEQEEYAEPRRRMQSLAHHRVGRRHPPAPVHQSQQRDTAGASFPELEGGPGDDQRAASIDARGEPRRLGRAGLHARQGRLPHDGARAAASLSASVRSPQSPGSPMCRPVGGVPPEGAPLLSAGAFMEHSPAEAVRQSADERALSKSKNARVEAQVEMGTATIEGVASDGDADHRSPDPAIERARARRRQDMSAPLSTAAAKIEAFLARTADDGGGCGVARALGDAADTTPAIDTATPRSQAVQDRADAESGGIGSHPSRADSQGEADGGRARPKTPASARRAVSPASDGLAALLAARREVEAEREHLWDEVETEAMLPADGNKTASAGKVDVPRAPVASNERLSEEPTPLDMGFGASFHSAIAATTREETHEAQVTGGRFPQPQRDWRGGAGSGTDLLSPLLHAAGALPPTLTMSVAAREAVARSMAPSPDELLKIVLTQRRSGEEHDAGGGAVSDSAGEPSDVEADPRDGADARQAELLAAKMPAEREARPETPLRPSMGIAFESDDDSDVDDVDLNMRCEPMPRVGCTDVPGLAVPSRQSVPYEIATTEQEDTCGGEDGDKTRLDRSAASAASRLVARKAQDAAALAERINGVAGAASPRGITSAAQHARDDAESGGVGRVSDDNRATRIKQGQRERHRVQARPGSLLEVGQAMETTIASAANEAAACREAEAAAQLAAAKFDFTMNNNTVAAPPLSSWGAPLETKHVASKV